MRRRPQARHAGAPNGRINGSEGLKHPVETIRLSPAARRVGEDVREVCQADNRAARLQRGPGPPKRPRVGHCPKRPGDTSRVVIFRCMNQQRSVVRDLPAVVLDILPRIDHRPGPGLPDSEHLHSRAVISHLRATSSSTARLPQKVCGSQPDPPGRPAAGGGAGLVTPATRGAADTCFTGREGGFMIRSGDGGGARRELRSPPTVPAQRGTGGCVPHDCDLTAAGIPADGMSCRFCHGVTHTVRKDGRDAPEPVRLPHRYLCVGDSVYAITGRRSLGLDLPPEFSRFFAYPCRAGQLSPVGDPLRRYCGTVDTRSGGNREDRQMVPTEIVGALYAAEEVGKRLVSFSSTNTAQCARPRRPRPCCRDGAGAGPGEERAGRGPPPESADRYLSGIPRHPAGAIPRPIRDLCPDPAPLTATPVRETCASCARRHPFGRRGEPPPPRSQGSRQSAGKALRISGRTRTPHQPCSPQARRPPWPAGNRTGVILNGDIRCSRRAG